MDWTGCEFVERVEGHCAGRPTIVGTRVWPEIITDWTEVGFTVEEIQDNFASVSE